MRLAIKSDTSARPYPGETREDTSRDAQTNNAHRATTHSNCEVRVSAKDPTLTLDPSIMTVEEVTRFAAQSLWDKQARDIQILDVEELVGYTDFLIIASARNERHVQALSNHLERQMRDLKLRSLSRDPVRNRRWVVCDYGDFVVHIFVVEERELYDLEGLWHEAERLDFIPKGAPSTPAGAPRTVGALSLADDEG